jgi:hypothetical protein
MVLIIILIFALTKAITPNNLSRHRAKDCIEKVKNTIQELYAQVFTKGLAGV